MPFDWTSATVGDFVDLQRGNTYQSTLLDTPGPVLLGLASIERDGGFRSDKLRTYGGESPAKLLVYPGDMYVSLKDVTQSGDLLGSVARVPSFIAVGRMTQDTVKLVFKNELTDRSYLYWVLRTPEYREYCRARGMGTTNLSLSRDDFLSFPVPEPTSARLSIQRTLDAIESKITLNRNIAQTLEAMAQAIFKSWFVDFDPVKAKIAAIQEGRDPLRAAMSAISGKPDAELDAMPREQYDILAATAALFPDEMEESALGEIPRGWFVRATPDCIEVNPVRTLKKGTVAQYLDMANVPTNSARVQNVVLREFTSGSKFRNGDTLLARITPCLENGKTAFVDFLNGDEVGWGSTEFIVLRPKNGLPEPFAYFLCRYPDFRAFAIAQMAGTSGRQRVPNDCFGGYKLVEPAEPVAIEFGRLAGATLNQIKALDEEAKTLATLRDTLLPKLLSGELSVTEAMAEAHQ